MTCPCRQESPYNPQTEAISPTLPADGLDESPLRSTKDELLGQISTIDREIMKAESQIAKLKRKQVSSRGRRRMDMGRNWRRWGAAGETQGRRTFRGDRNGQTFLISPLMLWFERKPWVRKL